MAQPLIRFRDVSKVFRRADGRGDLTAVDGLSLEVGEGEIVAVLGKTGCGKSTMFNLIAGLIERRTALGLSLRPRVAEPRRRGRGIEPDRQPPGRGEEGIGARDVREHVGRQAEVAHARKRISRRAAGTSSVTATWKRQTTSSRPPSRPARAAPRR